MTKEGIGLLKDFLQAILPILIFIFVVVLFFLYRKKIENFSSKITKIKGKIAGQEFETELRENAIEPIIATGNKPVEQNVLAEKSVEENTEGPIEETLFHVWSEYNKKNFSNADQIFERVQQKENDPQKRVRNEIFIFYIKAINGDVTSKQQLEEYVKNIKYEEEKFDAYENIGLISKLGRSFEKAIEEFNRAFQFALNDDQRVLTINNISECHYELGEFGDAEDIYLRTIGSLLDDKAKCKCWQNLAEFYNKRKIFFSRALTLEKALEYEPNNVDILFKLGYSYSECNLNAMAILHYKTLLLFSKDSSYAHNNLGVAYSKFSMPLTGNKEYKVSIEKGNTLAGGNLAFNLIKGGFYDEAKKIIDEAKKGDSYDSSINEALDSLNRTFKTEQEKDLEIIESAKKQERFFKKFHRKEFIKQAEPFVFSNEWTINDIQTTSISQDHLNITWQEGQSKFELSGSFVNFTSKDMKFIDNRPGYSILTRTSPGYAIINDEKSEIDIIILLENSHEIKEINLKRLGLQTLG